MKVLGYIALHYGKDYLPYAIESAYDLMDEILVLYTDKPSHGSQTSLTCPDTEEELINSALDVDHMGTINWFKGTWRQENEQRNFAHQYAKENGFNILVALDFDEVWKTNMLEENIKLTYDRKADKCLIWMRHLWRSFNYICDDPMRQERIYYLGSDKKDLIYAPQPENHVWHFGYARKPIDIEYKISIHGHSAEWLTSKDRWFKDKFMAWPPAQDTHPVCADTWNPKPFDKIELPELMKKHPFYNLDVIE